MTIEDILDETGGFGRFQFFIVLCMCLNRFTIGWSMLQMSYAGFIPDWLCQGSNATTLQNGSLKACFVNISEDVESSDHGPCDEFHFSGSPLTIINQWNLVCGLSGVKAAVTSIQMAGVLVGVILAEYLGGWIGRKKTMYVFVLEHAILNFITAFSVNWQMFAVCRFFIGLGIGVILVSSFPYPLEFLPIKWRPLVSALPVWSLGIGVFALAGFLMENWSHLHIACGALSIPGLLGYLYVPESLRWLTVHDQMKEAQNVVMKIAVVNKKMQLRKASIMLQTVAWEEQKARQNNKKYTYMDIFRTWQTAKITLMFSYHWFSLSLIYYGISFSISSFAGNIYVNIFLLALVELPATFLIFFSDRIRRKWFSTISFAVACILAFGCVLVQFYAHDNSKAAIITGLCLTTKLGVGTAWAVVEAWGTELYPAATRNFGLGAANVSARVGALIAPFLIDLDNMATASFIVMGCLMLINIIFCILTPETKGRKPANSSTNISAPKVKQIHTVDMNNEHGLGSESSTDAVENIEARACQDVVDTVLDTIDETDETDRTTTDSTSDTNADVDTGDVTLSVDTTDNSVNLPSIEDTASDNKDTISRKEKKLESKNMKKLKKASQPKESPEPKPRKNKMKKVKNGEILNGKSKSKPQDDSPPYIESKYHKNIRYSIY